MKTYRSYSIQNENGLYVARPMDGDDLRINSVHLPRIQSAIDALWDALPNWVALSPVDQLIAPRWLREWLTDPTSHIDLDVAHGRGAC